MKLLACNKAFSNLREGRLWTLLASDDAPRTLAIFQTVFQGSEELPQSVVLDRLADAFQTLRTQGEVIAQEPLYYLGYWRTKGWLFRTLRAGESEEAYGLTPDAAAALRFASSQLKPRTVATESRLASVMHQVIKLADDTDTDPRNRISTLYAERDRIEQELESLYDGKVKALDDDRASERAREIVSQGNELLDDFQNVRGSFERLNQDLRAKLLEAGGSRGAVLDAVFNGVDYIKNSDAGRSFSAFWRLLTDVEQSSALEEALEALSTRSFIKGLDPEDRRFLNNLTTRLFSEASSVQEVMHVLGSALNRFVRNEDPAKTKRISEVLQRASLAALALKDQVDAKAVIPFHMTQTVPQIRSIAQFQLKDPETQAPAAAIARAEASTLSLSVIQGMIDQSEIDLRALKANIATALDASPSVTLGDLLSQFPVTQGFGTVVGYITLGAKLGHVSQEVQVVNWAGADGVARSAELPIIHFSQDNIAAFQ